MKLIQFVQGKGKSLSSKRLAGLVMIVLGLLMSIILFTANVVWGVEGSTAFNVMATLLGSGSGLLLGGVLEK